MFERFTERDRKVVGLAQEEAGRLRHDFVDTEHLLLGLLREEEVVAAQALYACGITLDGVRDRVEGSVWYGRENTSQKSFTPCSKKVLELALREAMQLGHNYIGTEHILLGLLAEGGGVSATVLSSPGVDTERIWREVLGRVEVEPRPGSQEGPDPLGRSPEALQRSLGRYPQEKAGYRSRSSRSRRARSWCLRRTKPVASTTTTSTQSASC